MLLVLAPVAVFHQATGFGYVIDDAAIHLAGNPLLKNILSVNLLHIWQAPYWGMYIPVTYSFWALVASFVSVPFDPKVFHALNIVVHIINGLLMYALLCRIVKNRAAGLIGALFFLIHPLQVESVAWVSEFRGVLSAAFSLGCLTLYLAARTRVSGRWSTAGGILYGCSFILYLLALLSKPSAVALPLFIMILDIFILGARPVKTLLGAIIWLLPVIPVLLLTRNAQNDAVLSLHDPLWWRPFVGADAISFYMYKLILPLQNAVTYGRTPEYVMRHWWVFAQWIPPLALGVILWTKEKKPRLLFASFLLFIAGFLPVSGLVPFGFQDWSTVANRYAYLSLAGASLALSCGISRLEHRWRPSGFRFHPINAGAFVFLFALGAVSAIETAFWKDAFTLWSRTLALYPEEKRALLGRGICFMDRKQFREARNDFEQTARVDPDFAEAYFNLGNVFIELRKPDSAIMNFTRSIAIRKTYAEAWHNRGMCRFEKQDYARALEDYSMAISLSPLNPNYYLNRALTYFTKRLFDLAYADYLQILSIEPENGKALEGAAIIHYQKGDMQKAREFAMHAERTGYRVNQLLLK